jgi:predicted Zn-dependent protease
MYTFAVLHICIIASIYYSRTLYIVANDMYVEKKNYDMVQTSKRLQVVGSTQPTNQPNPDRRPHSL